VNAVPIEPAADVFAVGALLWEVLQGRRLFDAPTDVEVVERILQGPLPAIDPGERRIPIALLPLVEMALERTAERRIPNAAQLGDAIEHAPGVRLATPDEVALVVDQLVGPLIERRRERVNERFVLAESRSPSDSTLRPAIISHLRQAGAMKTPVGLVYPPPSSALVTSPTPSQPPSAFVPSDRWIDPSLPAPSSQYPSDSRWPAPSSSGNERRWDRSGSIPSAKAHRFGGKSALGRGWLYYLAIGAAIGGLVFEYLIESTPTAVPQPTTVLAPPAGAELPPVAPAVVPAAGTTATSFPGRAAPTGDTAPSAPLNVEAPAVTLRTADPLRAEPAVPRRPPPAPPVARPAPPRVKRPAAPPSPGVTPEGSQPAPSESTTAAPPTPQQPSEDWGI
jgi:serine/threonine-protein kinase